MSFFFSPFQCYIKHCVYILEAIYSSFCSVLNAFLGLTDSQQAAMRNAREVLLFC